MAITIKPDSPLKVTTTEDKKTIQINKSENSVNLTTETTSVVNVTARGPQGQKGNTGATGAQGPQGISAFSGSAESSSISTRLTTVESELGNTLISSSAQIASDISGSFTNLSSSLSTRLTTDETNITNLQTDSGSFSTRLTTAEQELENTLVSSSAAIDHDQTTNFVADEHIDHSSVTLTAGDGLSGGGDITTNRSFAVDATVLRTTGNNVISSSAQISSDISGSFTNASSSFSTRITAAESELGNTLISSSAQISSDISGSFTNLSSSLSTRLTTDETNITNLQTDSGSFSTRITTAETELSNTLISSSTQITELGFVSESFSTTGTGILSSSIQIASDISGSFTSLSSSLSTRLTTDETNITNLQTDSGSFSTRITTEETNVDNLQTDSGSVSTRLTTLEGIDFISSSAQISSDISGSFTEASASFSTRITTAETELENTLISSSAQVDLSQATGTAANATNAVNADNIALSSDNTNTNRYVPFTSTADGDGELRTDAGLLYNPNTNTITTTTFNGDLSGNATTATTATNVAFSGITGKPTLLSGSAQISSDISGSFVQPSSSFSTRVTTLETDLSTEQTNIDNLQTDSGSFSTRITNAETELSNTLISSSAQIASDISGSFVQPSSSFSTRVTTLEGIPFISSSEQIASDISGSFTAGTGVTISSGEISIGQDVGTTADVDFGNVTMTGSLFVSGGVELGGDIFPQTPQGATLGTSEKPFREIFLQSGSISIESSIPGDPAAIISNNDGNLDISVGGMRLVEPGNSFIAETGSFSFISGSMTQVGDYTRLGNMDNTGDLTVTGNISVGGNLDVSGTTTSIDSATLNIGDKNITIGSGSTTSFQLDGGGIDIGLGGTIANLRYQHSTTSITSSVDFRAPNFYGIFQGALSSSAQISSDISGSFTAASSSFSTRITTAETELDNTLFSGSAQVDHDLTTNFVSNEHIDHSTITLTAGDGLSGGGNITTNRSFAVDATVLRTNSGVISSSAQIASDISGSFTSGFEFTGTISGSSTSTGSFGYLIGDGAGIYNLPSAAITSYTNTGDNKVVTSVDSVSVQGEDNLTFNGSVLNVTGDMTITGDVSGSSTSTGSFGHLIGVSSTIINGFTFPVEDGTDGQALITDGDGVLSFNDIKVVQVVKNISGTTLQKGTPVHAVGSQGNSVEVIAASASDATTMPATFVLDEQLVDDEEGRAIGTGFINGVNTVGFTEGGVVYVGETGGYTQTKPTGTNLIQNIGIVTKVATNGSGFIYGSGRSNDVPNLLDNTIFYGSGSNQMQQIHISGALQDTTLGYAIFNDRVEASSFTGSLLSTNGVLSSSAQIADDISGSFTAGTGLDLSSGEFSVDVSDFMSNGVDNRILTATGTDAFRAEAGLTYDGSNLDITGNARATGDVIAYYSSDKRLKDNIIQISNPIEKIKSIGGYEFDWNDNQSTYEGHDIGVIAQEIEEVLPELVTTRNTGYKAVKYEKIIALLIEGIKEQQKQIDELKNKS